jgi:membrane peptidoglycan carboxypeptidase
MDFWAYIRVAKGLITLSPAGGGSTITQQLAKISTRKTATSDLTDPS